MNGIRNQSSSGGRVQAADPAFYPVLEALRRLQISGAVSLRLEKRGPEEVGVLVLAPSRSPQVNQDLKFVMDKLHLTPGKDDEITLAFGAVQRSDRELAVLSRSMAEILIELAAGIEVPAADVADGVTVPSVRLASAKDPRDRPLVRILSGPAPPRDAFCAIRYQDTWFWIDNHDFASKRVFHGTDDFLFAGGNRRHAASARPDDPRAVSEAQSSPVRRTPVLAQPGRRGRIRPLLSGA